MNIVAIGGGKKRPSIEYAIEHFVDTPNVLLIPSACSTEESHARKVNACIKFFQSVGLPNVDVLHDFNKNPTPTKLDESFGQAGIMYVIGGNTPYLHKTIRAHGSDQRIVDATRTGVTLSGTSAGALLPFRVGQTLPVPNPAEVEWEFENVPGLGLVPAAACVHANRHEDTPAGKRPDTRMDAFIANLPEGEQTGYAIDHGAALIFSETLREPYVIRETGSLATVHLIHEAGVTPL